MANETEALRAKITSEFQTRWADHLPTEFANSEEIADQSGPWCRFSILYGERKSAAVGTKHRRLTGIAALQVFVPRESGTRLGAVAFDAFAGAFDFAQFTVTLDDATQAFVVFRATYDGAVSATESGNPAHHQRTFYAPFYYDTAPA